MFAEVSQAPVLDRPWFDLTERDRGSRKGVPGPGEAHAATPEGAEQTTILDLSSGEPAGANFYRNFYHNRETATRPPVTCEVSVTSQDKTR
jgi:hypothetical protein